MRNTLRPMIVVLALFLLGTARVESSDFLTAVGSVEKFEKDTLTISTGDKPKKTVTESRWADPDSGSAASGPPQNDPKSPYFAVVASKS